MRLGLEVVERSCSVCSTTTEIKLPKELPSVEDMLKLLAGALNHNRTRARQSYSSKASSYSADSACMSCCRDDLTEST